VSSYVFTMEATIALGWDVSNLDLCGERRGCSQDTESKEECQCNFELRL
jgi:hypothetical protein